MEKICLSQELSSKLQLCRLLRYITNEALEGRGENLKGYTIGLEVFKKKDGFNPEQDPIVRIHAGRLRRMLKLYYLEAGQNDPILIEVPKGKYIPVFIQKQTAPKSLPSSPGKPEISESLPSVAIFPFKNLSFDPNKDHFAIGFSEELSVELTKYEDLVVCDLKTPANAFSKPGGFSDHVSQKDVRFIVDGGVQFEGTQLKVLVRLIDKKGDFQIWAERYIRNFSSHNLFETQESIVKEIAGIIGSEYGIILQKLTMDSKFVNYTDPDTYTAILKFYYFEARQTSEAALNAFSALESALKKDPGSGVATALLASLYANRYTLDLSDAERSYHLAGELAEKAKELDPNSLIVRIILAFKHFIYEDRERFLQEVDHCMAYNPNNTIRLGSIGFHLCLFGFWDRGKALLDSVMNSKILYPLYFHGATTLYYYRKKNYEDALEEALKYNVPSLFWGALLRAAVLGQLGRLEEAQINVGHLLLLRPDFIEKASYLISRFVKEPELVNQIIEGLRKAGMKIP